MNDQARANVIVSGRVQGVFFRAETREAARKLRVGGWVRNLPDGRVEAAFEGAKDAVEAMVNWCYQGSPGAQVTEVNVKYAQPEGLTSFQIR